jgi:O-antigen/teichoic acid export membrane protein
MVIRRIRVALGYESERQLFSSETAITGAGNAVILGMGLITSLLTARLLGPEGRGEYLTVYSWAGVAGMLLSGAASQSLVSHSKRGLPREAIQRFILRHMVAAATVGALGFGWALFSLEVTWLEWRHAVGAVLICAGTVGVSDLIGVAQGYGDIRRGLQRVRLAPMVTGVTTMSILAATGTRAAGQWILVISAVQLIPVVYELARLPPNPTVPPENLPSITMGAVARTAARYSVAGVASQINYRLDLLIVSAVLDRAAVATYGVAAATGSAVASIGQAVGMVHFGRFASREERGDPADRILKAAITAAAFGVLVAVPVILFAPTLVEFMYGREYRSAILPTQVLVLAAVPLSVDFLLIHAFLGFRQSLGRLYWVLGATSLMTAVGVMIAVNTNDLTLVAAVSPVVYTCSSAALLVLSRRIRAHD